MSIFEHWRIEALKSDHRLQMEAVARRNRDRADRLVGVVCVAVGLWLLFGGGS